MLQLSCVIHTVEHCCRCHEERDCTAATSCGLICPFLVPLTWSSGWGCLFVCLSWACFFQKTYLSLKLARYILLTGYRIWFGNEHWIKCSRSALSTLHCQVCSHFFDEQELAVASRPVSSLYEHHSVLYLYLYVCVWSVCVWSGCNWVPYHSRQRILSAFALSVEELGIGDVIKNAMQNDHGPLILKVSINQTQKDMKTITWPKICNFRYKTPVLRSFRRLFLKTGQKVSSLKFLKSCHSQHLSFCSSVENTTMAQSTTSGTCT